MIYFFCHQRKSIWQGNERTTERREIDRTEICARAISSQSPPFIVYYDCAQRSRVQQKKNRIEQNVMLSSQTILITHVVCICTHRNTHTHTERATHTAHNALVIELWLTKKKRTTTATTKWRDKKYYSTQRQNTLQSQRGGERARDNSFVADDLKQIQFYTRYSPFIIIIIALLYRCCVFLLVQFLLFSFHSIPFHYYFFSYIHNSEFDVEFACQTYGIHIQIYLHIYTHLPLVVCWLSRLNKK